MWDVSVVVMWTMIPHAREKQREETLPSESRTKEAPPASTPTGLLQINETEVT